MEKRMAKKGREGKADVKVKEKRQGGMAKSNTVSPGICVREGQYGRQRNVTRQT
jgi:hypothetical protein